jgi:hypothetical protein
VHVDNYIYAWVARGDGNGCVRTHGCCAHELDSPSRVGTTPQIKLLASQRAGAQRVPAVHKCNRQICQPVLAGDTACVTLSGCVCARVLSVSRQLHDARVYNTPRWQKQRVLFTRSAAALHGCSNPQACPLAVCLRACCF